VVGDLGELIAMGSMRDHDEPWIASRDEVCKRGSAVEADFGEPRTDEPAVFVAVTEPAQDGGGQEARPRCHPGSCRVARPWPLLRCCAYPRLHRVGGDIADDRERVRVVGDELRSVAALEHVARPLVVAVESDGVCPVQAMHRLVEIRTRCLDEQVVVVLHEAVRVAEEVVEMPGDRESREEDFTVGVGEEDWALGIAPSSHVVDEAGDECPGGTWHRSTVRAAAAKDQAQNATKRSWLRRTCKIGAWHRFCITTAGGRGPSGPPTSSR